MEYICTETYTVGNFSTWQMDGNVLGKLKLLFPNVSEVWKFSRAMIKNQFIHCEDYHFKKRNSCTVLHCYATVKYILKCKVDNTIAFAAVVQKLKKNENVQIRPHHILCVEPDTNGFCIYPVRATVEQVMFMEVAGLKIVVRFPNFVECEKLFKQRLSIY